jgi:hypothetical protein
MQDNAGKKHRRNGNILKSTLSAVWVFIRSVVEFIVEIARAF